MRIPPVVVPLATIAVLACSADPTGTDPIDAGTGDLQVNNSTSGDDPDGAYLIEIDGGHPAALSAGGSIVIGSLRSGGHAVALKDVAANCSVSGPNPINVSIVVGQVLTVDFHVQCTPIPTMIAVSVPGSGVLGDPAFWVGLDGGPPRPLELLKSGILGPVEPGTHTVLLTHVQSNCWMDDVNPATVTVAAKKTAEVVFTLHCPAYRTGVDVTVKTTGAQMDDSYRLLVCSAYCDVVWLRTVPANGTVQREFDAPNPRGTYQYQLGDVAANCTGTTEGTFQIVGRQVAKVQIDITCAAPSGAHQGAL